MIYDPCLFDLEDRGYGLGCGHFVLPDGGLIALGHNTDDETASALVRAGWEQWEQVLNTEQQGEHL